MANGWLDLDESRSPVIVFTFHGVFSDPTFDAYLERLTEIAQRPGRRALIYDIRRSGMVPASQRAKMAEWMKRHQVATRSGTAGMAFVIDQPMLRGVLTAILWLAPLVCQHTVVATMEEALGWSTALLRKEGVLPAEPGAKKG